jgi:hypothetical protein
VAAHDQESRLIYKLWASVLKVQLMFHPCDITIKEINFETEQLHPL